jgi:allantoin racemase
MKLWYQSLTRQTAWPAYQEALRRVLDTAKDPGTEIEIHGIEKRGGIGDQYRYLEFIEVNEVLENVDRATKAGFDAFLIGNMADPGLREAREICNMPVLGLCETSVHLANMMAGNFSLVTGNEKYACRIVENVKKYGLGEKLFAVRTMKVNRFVDLDQAFTNPVVKTSLINEFLSAASSNAAEGAEIVIPALGVFMVLLTDSGIHEVSPGIPILHGVPALVKMGEAVVKMKALFGGSWTSRRAMYAPPPLEQIKELRASYGFVYPCLGEPDSQLSVGTDRKSVAASGNGAIKPPNR